MDIVVHEVDCSSGEVVVRPMTAEEEADYQAQQVAGLAQVAQEQAAREARDSERAGLAAAAAAHPDPLVRHLAKAAGLL